MILRAKIDNTKKEPRIKFRCYRNGTYKRKKSTKEKQYSDGASYATNVKQGKKGKQSTKSKQKYGLHARRTNTALPLNDEDRCPFNFIVSWSPYGEDRWCVVAKDGCPDHEGHKPDMPSETKATMNDIGNEGRQIIKDVLDAGGTPTIAQVMVKNKTGVTLTTEQILRERQTIRHPEASKSHKSPAQKAVEFLQSDKTKSYILMVHEVGDVEKGSSFLTENTNGKRFQRHSFKTLVSKGDGSSPSIAVEETTESEEIVQAAPRRSSREKEAVRDGNDSDGDPYAKKYSTRTIRRSEPAHKSLATFEKSLSDPKITVDVTTHPPEVDESKEEYCIRIRKALQVSNDKTLLLAIAWVDDDEIRKFLQYPEVSAADDTAQTNSEARPMWVLTFLSRTNQIFTATRAYLPSRARFVYHWLWNEAIPTLLPQHGRNRMQLVVMDNDEREHGTFHAAIPKHYRDAKRRVCGFHLITQALLSAKNAIGSPATDSSEAAEMVKWFTSWLYSWLIDGLIQSEDEFVISKRDVFAWLDSEEMKTLMGDAWCSNAARFVRKSILPYQEYALSHHFVDGATFGMYTSSIAESSHCSNKATSTNPFGCRPCDPLDESLRKINTKAMLKMDQMLKNEAKATNLTPTWSKSNTSGLVNIQAECLLQERSIEASKILVYRKDATTWLCMDNPKQKRKTKSPITAFQRCYEVKHEDGCLVCPCKRYGRYNGIPCPEQVAILKTQIGLEHIGVSWHSQYGYRYGREGEEEITAKYDAAMAIDLPGPVVDLSSIVDYPRDASIEEFEAILNSSAPVIISSWNKKDGDSLAQAEADGSTSKVGAVSATSMGGGLKQTVSLSQHNVDVQMEESNEDSEDDDVAVEGSDAFKDFMPDYELMCRAADAHPKVRELAAQKMKAARDDVMQALNEVSRGGKNNSNSQGGMASSNVAGTEKSSQAKRKMTALERRAGKKKKK